MMNNDISIWFWKWNGMEMELEWKLTINHVEFPNGKFRQFGKFHTIPFHFHSIPFHGIPLSI